VTMDVYNSFDKLVPTKTVAPYLMSKVNAGDAKAAYAAFLEFKDVVKANPQQIGFVPQPSVPAEKLSAIDAAASVLSTASYPFMKEVDWTSDIFTKPLPSTSAKHVMKAVAKAISMGTTMDPLLLTRAAEAHHKAIGSIDAKGVTSAADYEAVNAALVKLIASVPQSKVIEVFNAFKFLAGPSVPNNLYQTVNAGDAVSAYSAFWNFKDVVAR